MKVTARIVEFQCGWSFLIDVGQKISIEPYKHFKSINAARSNLRRWIARIGLREERIPVRVVDVRGKITMEFAFNG